MNKLNYILTAFLLFLTFSASAQFYTIGDENGMLNWRQISTLHYKLIYPEGLDSLSRVYAFQLERYWDAVGITAGYLPGEFYRNKIPVILHARHGLSNGSVSLAPMRMDLFTLPQAYNPGPMPWEQSLAVHESRHMSQIQFGKDKALKPFNWILGQMFSGAMTAVYPNLHLLEGDAVVAETGLTSFGRGREASFLNFYQVAFNEGDDRSWNQWRYGSYKRYAPNYYALGYLTIAGTRYCYDYPDFTRNYFNSVARQPYKFSHMKRTVKKASGKNFKDSFTEITSTFHRIWTTEKAERAPFDSSRRIMQEPDWFTSYSEVCVGEDALYALKTGKVVPCVLVKIGKDGREEILQQFSHAAGGLCLEEGRLWWSESVPDPRWSLKMQSIIRYRDLKTGKIHDLTRKGRYFNPCPSPDGKGVAVAEYAVDGQNSLVLLDRTTGEVLYRHLCPPGMQPVESVWKEGILYFNAITSGGTGIYRLQDKEISQVLPPQPTTVRDLTSDGKRIFFSSDRNGVNEMYELEEQTGQVFQLTSLEYGGTEFCFDASTGHLVYAVLNGKGNLLYQTPSSELNKRQIDWNEVHRSRIAEKLTEQEKEKLSGQSIPWPDDKLYLQGEWQLQTSEPQPYRKGLKMFNFHSWAPLYVSADAITNIDNGGFSSYCGLGATAFFQSELGDAYGTIGYCYGQTGENGQFRSSGHLSFTYKGFYPVLQAQLHFGERHALQYFRRTFHLKNEQFENSSLYIRKSPSFHGSLTAYLPLDYSSTGWRRGLTPKLNYSFSNDLYNKSSAQYDLSPSIGIPPFRQFTGYQKGKNVFLQNMDISLRAYCMQDIAPAKVWPNWGAGLEAGWSGRLGLTDLYGSVLYCYSYAYLPGIWKNQGLNLSAFYQHQFKSNGITGESYLNVAPRGFTQYNVMAFISSLSTNQCRLSADYSIPIYVGDIDWFCPLFYIKNLELRPYADYTWLEIKQPLGDKHLFSLGTELTIHAANFLWIPYHNSFGISCSYNGGSMMELLNAHEKMAKKFHIGFIFRINL